MNFKAAPQQNDDFERRGGRDGGSRYGDRERRYDESDGKYNRDRGYGSRQGSYDDRFVF